MTELKQLLLADARAVEEALDSRTAGCDTDYGRLGEAMRYSLLGGGKRLRAHLVLAFCRLLGGAEKAAMPLACAIEMVHAFSLIHDDLPCMDNDDLRRGKPTCHRVYGEDTALLAGDALLAMAFSQLADASLSSEQMREALRLLSRASGRDGMVGGQVLDMIGESEKYGEEKLKKMQSLKTGALISCSCELGVIAAGGGEPERRIAREYAAGIGLAFQITDDILDAEGDETLLGKKTGSDAANQKTTFYTLLGREKAYQLAFDLTEKAKKAVSTQSGADDLCCLADALLKRNF